MSKHTNATMVGVCVCVCARVGHAHASGLFIVPLETPWGSFHSCQESKHCIDSFELGCPNISLAAEHAVVA